MFIPTTQLTQSGTSGGGSPVIIWPQVAGTVVQGTWDNNSLDSNVRWFNTYWGNFATKAQNDEMTWQVYLMAGTWRLDVYGLTATYNGIADWRIDGSSIGTQDWYSGSTVYNLTKSITGITVASSGIKVFGPENLGQERIRHQLQHLLLNRPTH